MIRRAMVEWGIDAVAVRRDFGAYLSGWAVCLFLAGFMGLVPRVILFTSTGRESVYKWRWGAHAAWEKVIKTYTQEQQE